MQKNNVVLLKGVSIGNKSGCLLEDSLTLDFSLQIVSDTTNNNNNLENVHWKLVYVVDMANTKHVVPLGQSQALNYANISGGELITFKFHVDRINLDGVSPMLLNNVAVIVASLFEDEKEELELFKCSMVVQVDRNEQDGKLYRNILNPLE